MGRARSVAIEAINSGASRGAVSSPLVKLPPSLDTPAFSSSALWDDRRILGGLVRIGFPLKLPSSLETYGGCSLPLRFGVGMTGCTITIRD